MTIKGVFGPPGYKQTQYFTHKFMFCDGVVGFWPGGGNIDVAKSRGTSVASDNIAWLPPGTFMGKITSSGYYAPSVIGVTAGALANAGTSITLSAQQATELVRRIGSTGTLTLTGPPTANGTARVLTAAYSAVNTTSGVVTITTPTVNEVQTLNWTNTPAGAFRIAIVDLNGVLQYTQPITYSATAATLVSNINTALDATFGAGLIVASGSVVTAIAVTFSGAGYTGLPQTLIEIDTDSLTAGDVDITRTTTGVDGRFVAGSYVGANDGSNVPKSIIDGGYGLTLFDDANAATATVPWPQIPVWGTIQTDQLPLWPSDTGLRTYLRTAMSTTAGAKFMFSDQF